MCVCVYVCMNQMFDVKSDVSLFVCTNQMFGLIVVYSLVQSVHYLYFEYEIKQNFIFDGINNVCHIYYHLQDIWSRNMHDLDLDL